MPGTPTERDPQRSSSRRAARSTSALRAAARRIVGRGSKPVAAAAKSASADVTASAKKAGAKKAGAKKTGAKKTGAKKTAAKKTGAKRTGAKKTAAKKTAAKKTGAKKTGAKKTAAKKTGAKKTGGRRGAGAPVTPRRGGLLPVLAGEDPWTKAEIAEVRGELDEERQRLLGEVAAAEQEIKVLLRDGGDGAGNDQADIGSKALERDAEMSLANNSREMLFQVERAMTRLEDGSYGLCESCGQPIGKLRLMAFPRATLCMTCKQRQERR